MVGSFGDIQRTDSTVGCRHGPGRSQGGIHLRFRRWLAARTGDREGAGPRTGTTLSGVHRWPTQGPPEDCGGIPGFYNLLEAIRNPEHEEHEELSEWLGRDFDPNAFSLNAVNRRLAHLQHRRSKSAATSKVNPPLS